jgi:signal transduction histidine kinase
MRVLIAEDDPRSRYMLATLLAGHGFEVVTASDGVEALEQVRRASFDLLLSDLLMPRLDGFQLCRTIKADPGLRHIPILVYTATYTAPADEELARAAGADSFLIKPSEPDKILAAVEQILHGNPPGRPAPSAAAASEEEGSTPGMLSELAYVRQHNERLMAKLSRKLDQLQQTNAHLSERTAQLMDADRRKNAFLAMLAHELRNPLASLRNALSTFHLRGVADPTMRQELDIMDRQVRHLARLVDDLLDVSRIMRGKIQLQTERLDLARLVRTAAEDHRGLFQQAAITLDVAVPALPVWVMGDSIRLAQVLSNLLENAAKFTGTGGQVGVRLTVDTNARHAEISVRDTGIGIEPEMLPRLFETFTQADRSLARSKGGLGLGLAFVKELTKLHGGEVHAASAGPGRGAEFTIRLPVQPEPAALAQMPAPPRRFEKRFRILVVEDNRDAADSLRFLLELYGCEVAVAYTGPDGVQVAERWQPDVVLCDIGLPGLDGYGVASQLRHNPSTSKARLIAVTGYGTDDDKQRSREVGFDAHLVKPVDPDVLQRVLLQESFAVP